MRNRILLIVFLLFIILLIVTMLVGIRIGGLEIPSISSLKVKNEDLNIKISDASKLTTIDYQEAIDTLNTTYERHTLQKEKYEELSALSEDDDKKTYETKKYDISYLWKTVGKYATSRNLVIAMDVAEGTAQNLYDLNFTVNGQYVNISQFITDIENNSDLYFRIYNFKMTGASEKVTATFTVKDVNIDPSTITTTTTQEPDLQIRDSVALNQE